MGESRHRLRPDDHHWVPRRASPRRRRHCPAVVLLGRCDDPLLLHREGIDLRLEAAGQKETDANVRELIWKARWWTVVSWLTYPIVYIIPLVGFHGQRAPGAQAVLYIQCGYCLSDIISKCGVGLLIYQITYAKSQLEKGGLLA